MTRILYLVHDLTDAAVERRTRMLVAGGAEVQVAGFRREDRHAGGSLSAAAPIDLGVTRDGRFAQRLGAVAQAALSLRRRLGAISRPDVIIARNLEMLALADRAAGFFADRPAVVYECLDIHRLLLADNAIGSSLRAAERRLCGRASLVLTSSPAFVRAYFDPVGQIASPVEIIENKVLDLGGDAPDISARRAPPEQGEPWRIGWFGALRCARSLAMLSDATRRMGGGLEVVLRGRPATAEIPDFEARVAAEPFIHFAGPYRNPADLASIYGDVHFNWAIDYFEEGMNSEWLLPNRLYEGGRHGAIAIAREDTETARCLKSLHTGVILADCGADAIVGFFAGLDRQRFARLREAADGVDAACWTHGPADCRALVDRLAGLRPVSETRKAAA